MRADDDPVLVARARRGSSDALGELFDRHAPAAWRAAYAVCGRRALADEIVQDAFERVLGKLTQYDDRRAFGPWLHRIVMNRALDVLRREGRYASGVTTAQCAPPDEDVSEFLGLVGVLDPERRVAVVMRYGLGYAPAQIAEILGTPVGTVHSRLARALEDLRTQTEATLYGR